MQNVNGSDKVVALSSSVTNERQEGISIPFSLTRQENSGNFRHKCSIKYLTLFPCIKTFQKKKDPSLSFRKSTKQLMNRLTLTANFNKAKCLIHSKSRHWLPLGSGLYGCLRLEDCIVRNNKAEMSLRDRCLRNKENTIR